MTEVISRPADLNGHTPDDEPVYTIKDFSEWRLGDRELRVLMTGLLERIRSNMLAIRPLEAELARLSAETADLLCNINRTLSIPTPGQWKDRDTRLAVVAASYNDDVTVS